jgi:endonuclease-3
MTSSATIANTARIEAIADILDEVYGPRLLHPSGDPTSELISTILSQNTTDTNTARSWKALSQRFPDWDDMREAPVEHIVEAIRSGGLANRKAPRIQTVLDSILEHRGGYDLTFLRDLELQDAMQWLTELDGVGPKTAACVLLFSLGMPALPVDTHVHRVALRLGIVPPRTSPGNTQRLLEPVLGADPQRVYAFHVETIQHGRTICKARSPRCDRCPLRNHCDYGQHFHA